MRITTAYLVLHAVVNGSRSAVRAPGDLNRPPRKGPQVAGRRPRRTATSSRRIGKLGGPSTAVLISYMGLRLAEVLQGGAEVVDGLVLVGAEVIDHHHIGAGPVGAGEVTASGGRRDEQRVMRDLDVVAHLVPRDPGRDQGDRGRVAVVDLEVVGPARPLVGS